MLIPEERKDYLKKLEKAKLCKSKESRKKKIKMRAGLWTSTR